MGNWCPATNLFDLQQEAYSHCGHNSNKPISAISWLAYRYQLFAADAQLNWTSHIFLALAAETGFLKFKEQVPLKFKNINISGSMQKEDLSIDITFNLLYVSFCLTVS
jgi:hypothetical protein